MTLFCENIRLFEGSCTTEGMVKVSEEVFQWSFEGKPFRLSDSDDSALVSRSSSSRVLSSKSPRTSEVLYPGISSNSAVSRCTWTWPSDPSEPL